MNTRTRTVVRVLTLSAHTRIHNTSTHTASVRTVIGYARTHSDPRLYPLVSSHSHSDNHKLAQADAEEARKSALAMAQQLRKCVEDLAEAQKRIAANDAVPVCCVCVCASRHRRVAWKDVCLSYVRAKYGGLNVGRWEGREVREEEKKGGREGGIEWCKLRYRPAQQPHRQRAYRIHERSTRPFLPHPHSYSHSL